MTYEDLKTQMEQDARLKNRLIEELQAALLGLRKDLMQWGALEKETSYFGRSDSLETLANISYNGGTASAIVHVQLDTMDTGDIIMIKYCMIPTTDFFSVPRRSICVKRPMSGISPIPTEVRLNHVPDKVAELMFKHLAQDFPLGAKSYQGN